MPARPPTPSAARRRSRVRKLVASALLGCSLLVAGVESASAFSLDGPTITDPGIIGPIKPSLPPWVQPIAPTLNVDAPPEFRSSDCSGRQYWADFGDPDGSDLRMTIEIGYVDPVTDEYRIVEMVYGKQLDRWHAEFSSRVEGDIVVQAIDEDGNYSSAVAMRRQHSTRSCVFNHDFAFTNDQNTDIFDLMGVR